LFAFDSARLKTPIAALDEFAAALQANPDISRVVISGHTDQLGSDAYNRRLSQQRADAVKAYLVSKGVAANRLVAEGMSFSRPVVDCKTGNQAERVRCGAPNRRVEVEPITVPKR
jgi:OOP family OmpA-OmpF porin